MRSHNQSIKSIHYEIFFTSIKNYVNRYANLVCEFNKLERDFDELKESYSALFTKVEDLENAPEPDTSDLEDRVKDLEEKFGDYDLWDFDNRLDDLEAAVGRNDCDELDERISCLEDNVKDMGPDNVEKLSDKIDALDEVLYNFRDEFDTLQETVDNLEAGKMRKILADITAILNEAFD